MPGIAFSWSSANPTVASVSSTGWAKGAANGATDISATTVSPSASLPSPIAGAIRVVVQQVVRSVRLTAPDTIASGDSVIMMAVALGRAGAVIPGIAFGWSASDTSVASLNAAGRLVAKSYGSTTIEVVPTGPATFLPGPGGQIPRGTARVVVRLVFTQISAGGEFTCGLARGGIAHCWGENQWGQLGNGIATGFYAPISSPVAALTDIRFRSIEADDVQDGRSGHACAVAVDGSAYCWGSGAWGMLGDGRHGEGIPVYSNPFPTRVSSVGEVRQTALGGSHTCLLTTDGSTWCAGSNFWGEIGIADMTSACPGTGEYCVLQFNKVPGALQFTSLVAGDHHNCGLLASGDTWCWGLDITGNVSRVPAPVAVPGGFRFKILAAGGLNTCGVAEDDFAYCWGQSWFGETGTGNASPGRYLVTSPTRVTTLERFVQFALGLRHGCGLTADGRVFCWGLNDSGELGATTSVICGDPSIPNAALGSCSPTPIAVTTQLRFTAITAGAFHTCGLVANGDVYCWGGNAEGQLGAGYVSPRAGVVKVISLR